LAFALAGFFLATPGKCEEELIAKKDQLNIKTSSVETTEGKKKMQVEIDPVGDGSFNLYKPGDPLPFAGKKIIDTAVITIFDYEGSTCQWVCKMLSSGDQKCYWKC